MRFTNDWATEEIVKQFIKNKRKNHYANGWLEVPNKYEYLKANSRKRSKTAPRKKKALDDAVDASTRGKKQHSVNVDRAKGKGSSRGRSAHARPMSLSDNDIDIDREAREDDSGASDDDVDGEDFDN